MSREAHGTMYYMEVQISPWEMAVLGDSAAQCNGRAKNVRTDRAAVLDGEWGGPEKSYMGVHIGATRQMRLNDCVWRLWADLPLGMVATWSVPKLLWAVLFHADPPFNDAPDRAHGSTL